MLFFAAADESYEFFAPLYIFFALTSNKDASCEIVVENHETFQTKHKRSLNILNEKFGERYNLKSGNFSGRHPAEVRFLEGPSERFMHLDHVYIGDIDLFVFDEDVERQHTENIAEHSIPFSNIIRSGTVEKGFPRLSGLHFAPMCLQYPAPDPSDYPTERVTGADENMLYNIMRDKGVMIPEGLEFRPTHGVHVSLNRHPFGRPPEGERISFQFEATKIRQTDAWHGIENPAYRKQFLDYADNSDEFNALRRTLDDRAKEILHILEFVCRENFEMLVTYSKKYVIDPQDIVRRRRKRTVAEKVNRRFSAVRRLLSG